MGGEGWGANARTNGLYCNARMYFSLFGRGLCAV